MPVKAVFFDIDGTLVDSNEFHVMAWQEAFRDHGRAFEAAEIRSQIGKGADQLIPALATDFDEKTRKAAAARHGEIFQSRYLKQVKPFPHATELVRMVYASGKRVILASSAQKREVNHYVDQLKLSAMLSGTVSANDVAHSKPAGDIFAAALCRVFPVTATEALVVGDTPYDVESARRSGIKTIALRSGGFSENTLVDAGAAYIYASAKQLLDEVDNSPLRS